MQTKALSAADIRWQGTLSTALRSRDEVFEHMYAQLNDRQKKAVDEIFGPVMVLAGPGTGKTQLLSVRTANILRQTDSYPSNILILTFTNAGVKAMRERLAKMIGPDGYDVVVETFHSFANWVLTESDGVSEVLGERIEMTELEQVQLVEYLLDHLKGTRALRPSGNPYLYRRDIVSNISALRKDGVTPDRLDQFLIGFRPDGVVFEQKHLERLKAFSVLYRAYEEAKQSDSKLGVFDARGRYDFDDMILFATEVLRREPDLLDKYREQFQFVMVDEFQDSNGSQLELLSTLYSDSSPNLCMVGDDDQSIYRFQGASAGTFHIMEKLLPTLVKVTLTENYRSRSEVLEVGRRIIQQVPDSERVGDKVLTAVRGEGGEEGVSTNIFGTEEEELTSLTSEIKKIPKNRWKETAVLVRTRKQAGIVIDAFLQTGIPYATDGKEDIRGEFRIQQLLKVTRFAAAEMDFEQKDLLLFDLLMSDFFEIPHEDLMTFAVYVHGKKASFRSLSKRKTTKSTRDHVLEETQHSMELFDESSADDSGNMVDQGDSFDPASFGDKVSGSPSLLSELMIRFPNTERDDSVDPEDSGDESMRNFRLDSRPEVEDTAKLTLVHELKFRDPVRLHRAAWALRRLTRQSASFPVHSLMMNFLSDTGLVDFILRAYHHDEVVLLRDLRSVSSFVENLKKATDAKPDIKVSTYLRDVDQLEKHEISFRGEMVSSTQDGVHILTAHSSKGLEFETVFLPFCLHDSSWPKRDKSNLIPLPSELMVGQEQSATKEEEKRLHEFDETRLFYVAATRARDRLVFTAAPKDKRIVSRLLTEAWLTPDGLTLIPEQQTLVQRLTKTARPDPIADSRDILSGIVDHMTLSPSGLNTYLSCRRKFLYHHLLLAPQPKQQALVYGQCVHKALEKCFRRFMKEGKLPTVDYFEEQFRRQLSWEGVEQAIIQGCEYKLEDAKKWYERELVIGPEMPLELEKRMTRKMADGLVFNGQFDKVENDGQGVRVVDYKTGEPDKHVKAIDNFDDLASEKCDDYLRQLVAYKMLYDQRYRGRTVTSGQLVFLDPVKTSVKKYDLVEDAFVKKTVPLTREMVKEYERILGQAWTDIRDLKFARLPDHDEKKCTFCPYSDVCWN